METAFIRYLETIFEHPEIISASVRNVVIDRENIEDSGKRAFEAGFHDCFSDTDLSVKVCLPSDGSVTPDQYMKRIDRFGVNSTTALGWCFVPENKMYRIIFRDGMRYDFGFEFEYGPMRKLSGNWKAWIQTHNIFLKQLQSRTISPALYAAENMAIQTGNFRKKKESSWLGNSFPTPV